MAVHLLAAGDEDMLPDLQGGHGDDMVRSWWMAEHLLSLIWFLQIPC